MAFALEQSWREIFAIAVEAKAAKRRDEQARLFYEEFDHEKDKKQHTREKNEKELKEWEDALATSEQITAFNARLDTYDTKTVEALMENREALDRVGDELRRMTDAAYVLPDGRRVFKTADGRQVFDEHGLEVPLKTIDPEAIGDNHPGWEAYKAAKAVEGKLEAERHGLLEFQAKVDDARARVDKGDITKKDLDALDADLKASAPPSMRQKIGFAAPEASGEAKMRSGRHTVDQAALAESDAFRRSLIGPAPM